MCGIAGIHNFASSEGKQTEHQVKNMLATISHRGPDESGVLVDENTAIGNVRLSIIDLSSGQQPMSDVSGRYWIVYNGEIFNYKELRNDLIKQGIKLRTTSDTEVVVQLYALLGAGCLSHFNGQFAFCIWDKETRELFLARDRVGIRPLFYWSNRDSFAFCSEIKGLFTLGNIERSLDTESFSQIFTFWTTITPRTPFKNILELQPGHFMHVTSSGVIQIKKYWSLTYSSGKNDGKRFDDAVDELDYLISDAVKIRLRADVPVGAYLSGGLDSTVTTAYIKKINPDVLNTFSIGFTDKEFDETNYQLEAAQYLDTNHTAFLCSAYDLAENFQKTIWHTEFPILRTSPTPMFLLSKKVRESNIKVVITGEGADEMLGGYNIFKEAKIRRFWANEPNSKARPKLLAKLYPYIPLMKDSSDLALKMFFGYRLKETADPLYSHQLRWHNTSRVKSFFSDDMLSSFNGFDPLEAVYKNLPEQFKSWSTLSQSQYLEATIFMSGYLLSSQGDRMAMGNSVEGRYPFLDYRLIEFANQLPDSFKLNGLNEKFILKKLSKGRIPESISSRSKQAYRAPITNSLFSKTSPEQLKDMLTSQTIREFGIFNPQKVDTLVSNIYLQKQISETDQMAAAGILSTQLLFKMFIKDPVIANADSLKNYRVINIREIHR